MTQPISFRWSDEFVAQIDQARGNVPRSAFVRLAVEQMLSPLPHGATMAIGKRPVLGNAPTSVQARADVKPIPKAPKH